MKLRVKKYTRRYPWRMWFNQGTFTLHRGSDYEHKSYVMAQMIRNAAARRQYWFRCNIAISEDEKSLTVKVTKRAAA